MYRRQPFLEDSNRAFEALRTHSEGWGIEQAEREVWEMTLSDGLEKEGSTPGSSRGEIWLVDLNPTGGCEQARVRPG